MITGKEWNIRAEWRRKELVSILTVERDEEVEGGKAILLSQSRRILIQGERPRVSLRWKQKGGRVGKNLSFFYPKTPTSKRRGSITGIKRGEEKRKSCLKPL